MGTPKPAGRDGAGRALAIRIVTAVAEAEGIDVTAVEPPLAEVVPVEALERILQSADGAASAEFEYRGWEVGVRGNGTIDLRKPPDAG